MNIFFIFFTTHRQDELQFSQCSFFLTRPKIHQHYSQIVTLHELSLNFDFIFMIILCCKNFMPPFVNELIVVVIGLHSFCESEGKDKIEISYSLHL
jgi:hypothetical protein